MTRSPPRSRGRSAALVAAFVGCFLLLAACAPRAGTSGSARVAAGVGVTGATNHDAVDAASLSSGVAATVGSHLSPACAAPALGATPDRLVVRGQERVFLSHAPIGAAGEPRDLVIAFHGRTNDAARARRYFRLDETLPEAVIVYPQALRAGPGTFAWSDPGDPTDALRDFALVDAIIDAFGEARCIDLDRVFVVGHSLGAFFANDVACSLGDRVRAVASVAGGLQGGRCVPGTATLLLHHPDDPLVPMNAGERARDAFRIANGLADATRMPVAQPDLARLLCQRYGDAEAADPVVWCAHDDASWPGGRYDPHTWPAGAPAAIAAFLRGLP